MSDEPKPEGPKPDEPKPDESKPRDPVAWEASSTFAGEGKLISELPRIVNRKGELLGEGPRDEDGRILHVKRGGGRSRNFDDEQKADLITRLEPHVLKRRGELGRLPFREDEVIKNIARRLVNAKGLESSDDVIRRQIIDPVLQKLRLPS